MRICQLGGSGHLQKGTMRYCVEKWQMVVGDKKSDVVSYVIV